MATDFKDYYQTLGVARDATEADVKKAFSKLARVHHPDVATDKAAAEDKFKEINEAYEVLGDPEKRKKYDTLGADWNRQGGPPPQWGGGFQGGPMSGGAEFQFDGTGFSDFFEHYFSGGGARRAAGFGGGFSGRGGAMRGQDIECDLMVTLEEAFHGAMRTISLRKADPRTGQVSTDEVQVRIPAGIGEGQRLRVPGHGGQGSGDAPDGDLYLRVRFASHPDFRVRGHNIHCELAVTHWEAVLGATIPLKVPGGKSVQIKIPAGTSPGDQLRMKGYGLPKKNAPGDLYVDIAVATPPAVSEEERGLWEKLRDVTRFKPREI